MGVEPQSPPRQCAVVPLARRRARAPRRARVSRRLTNKQRLPERQSAFVWLSNYAVGMEGVYPFSIGIRYHGGLHAANTQYANTQYANTLYAHTLYAHTQYAHTQYVNTRYHTISQTILHTIEHRCTKSGHDGLLLSWLRAAG